MRLLLIAAAAVISTWTALPVSAAVILTDDIGGKMEDYTARFQQVRRSGETIVIDGTCLSACPKPHLRHRKCCPRLLCGLDVRQCW